jgi:hypothetical protein
MLGFFQTPTHALPSKSLLDPLDAYTETLSQEDHELLDYRRSPNDTVRSRNDHNP